MPFAAVVFDLDGTLLDSLADIANAANEVLAELGLPTHAIDRYRQLVGEGVTVLFQRALADRSSDMPLVERCVAGFRESYAQHWNRKSRPYPGIPELLDALAARRLRMAVLSNKPQEFTERCVREYFAGWPIAPVLGQRPETPRKPDPAGALEIAAGYGVSPADCIYVGDSLVDMQTACRAGMFAVGVQWGFRTTDELVAHGAAALVEHPCELLRFLD